ncbi:MAG: aldo/keto reductase, partial [Myxococcota bacterium]
LGTAPGEPDGADDLLYREAVARALRGGLNVLDTALSYRMQTSERSLGAALRRAIAEGTVARDEVYVITKAGYLTPDPDRLVSPASLRRDLIETYVDSGLVDPRGVVGGNHSLDVAFLRDQIQRSRTNLGLATIDLYCLQDPELHLLAKGPDEFQRLLTAALEMLEEAVTSGWIAAYGLSTWSGLLVPHTEKGHLSLAECFQLALDVGGPDHHLRGIQLPYGVAMGEGMSLPTQRLLEGAAPVLAALRDTGCASFVSAPLARGRATRGLPDFLHRALPGLRSDAQRALQFARSTANVSCALVGMRRTEHVDEGLELLRHPPVSPEAIEALFEEARRS